MRPRRIRGLKSLQRFELHVRANAPRRGAREIGTLVRTRDAATHGRVIGVARRDRGATGIPRHHGGCWRVFTQGDARGQQHEAKRVSVSHTRNVTRPPKKTRYRWRVARWCTSSAYHTRNTRARRFYPGFLVVHPYYTSPTYVGNLREPPYTSPTYVQRNPYPRVTRIPVMKYKVLDRGFDREYRFCCKVPASVDVGDRIDTEHGSLLVFSVGRTFGEPPMRYAYVDVDAETVGAPTDRLTAEQAAYRERAPAYVRQRANDEAAAAAILAALERDGWSNRRNTPGVPSALKRVYAELVASHVLRLDGYRYVPA